MSWYVEANSFEEELLSYKYEILIKQGIQKCIDLVNEKNKQINELKLCNSDYYNMLNNCTSKLSRIRERASYDETNAESLSHDILSIINDKEICLKPFDYHTKEALDFIDRYLSLDLDNFNASCLLRKLRDILRGDKEIEEKQAYNKIYNRNQKAIEYIKNIPDDEFVESEYFTEILEILKGEDE